MLYGVGIGATAFFTLLGPAAARHSAHSLIVVRVLMGLAQVPYQPRLCMTGKKLTTFKKLTIF